MRPENQIDPKHDEKRSTLRVLGVIIFVVGLIFMITGLVSFFSAFGSFEPPRLFWCCFGGMPLLWLGAVLGGAGFMGALARYTAGESAPVAKDTINYMADGTKEGLRTVATAVAEGVAAGAGVAKSAQVHCPKCNEPNNVDSRFCKSCGSALPALKTCPACQATNDADAKFCDQCGRALV